MLNTQQQFVFDSIIKAEAKDKFSLSGEAGTGKTFLISQLASAFIADDKTVLCLAPTHEAKNVLKANFDKELLQTGKISFQTIAKASGSYPVINQFGEANFLKKEAFSSKADLIIADEMSMIAKRHVKALLNLKTIVVFVGDMAQLRVVNDKSHNLLESKSCIHFRLTEQMRASTQIEEIAKRARDFELPYYPESEIESRQSLIDKFLSSDLSKSVYLTYTNKLANEVAQLARDHIYGKNSQPFVSGEMLLARFNANSVKTNERFKILSVNKLNDEDYELEISPGEFIITKAPAKFRAWQSVLSKLKDRALKFKEQGNVVAYNQIISEHFSKLKIYSEVAYPYAHTIHKSQGKTIDNVFVDTLDIFEKGNDRKRLLYVAYSRASKSLHTIGNKPDAKFIFRYITKKLIEISDCKIPVRRFNDKFGPNQIIGHFAWHMNCQKQQVIDMLTTEQKLMLASLGLL